MLFASAARVRRSLEIRQIGVKRTVKSEMFLQRSDFESQKTGSLSETISERSCDTPSESVNESNVELSLNNEQFSSEESSEPLNSCSSKEPSNGQSELMPASNVKRYLPIFSPDLNLRAHIESAGHQMDFCPYIIIDPSTCKGYLYKLGATFHLWSKRWFVFDRNKKAFMYFSDKSEKNLRGGDCFEAIEKVYLSHSNASNFIVKTKRRIYDLHAASEAAAKIWIDAIVTGAHGNSDV